MTELVHSDQTGFMKSRLATDNIRRILHVIDGAQSLSYPAAVLSLDVKSALLPLNQAMCNVPIPASIPVSKNFIYLGIDIYFSVQTIAKNNFGNTLHKIFADLDRWSSLPNSICGRVAIIKMNILPRVNFVSSMLPLPPPPQYWCKLQSAITKFIWHGKRPRINLTTMQRER